MLTEDEKLIEQRKLNVRRFGAAWLRPPGVAKTFQARMDEDQERAEQAEMARREAQLLEMAQAAEAEAGNAEAEQEQEEERDLDADVPDAEEEEDEEEDEDEEDSDEEVTGVDVTFNEESLMEGSIDGDGRDELEMEEAELIGRLQDERDLGLERDLDDSVPEAGSYQHTDTELEDDTSEEEDSDAEPLSRQTPRSVPRNPVRTSGGNVRSSRILANDPADIMGSSSFVGSSPAMGRGPGQGNAFRSRMLSRRGRGS
jgi:hypothetical protein